jgi:uncharacterized protein YdeI (YjbR/CyaY-like superfamily)
MIKIIKKPRSEIGILSFPDSKKWNAWLSKNHAKSDGIWVKFFKKDSGIKSINHDVALDEALCFGWIDGQTDKYDDKSWLQKFTPRRSKSMWSKRNVERAEQLISLKRMQSSGIMEINKAKEDGRWGSAYDSPSKMTIPDDFLKKLSENKRASKFFETLNRINKYSIAWRLQTATKPEIRRKRMSQILEMLSKNEKFH